MIGSGFYPVDISGVSQIGFRKWLSDYPPNLRCGLYQKIHSAVFDAFLASMPDEGENPRLYYAAVSNYKIVFAVSHMIYDYASLSAIESHGFSSVGGKTEEKISDVRDRYLKRRFPVSSPLRVSSQEIMKERLRLVKVNLGKCALVDFLFPSRGRSEYYLVGDRMQKECQAYVSEKGISPLCLRPLLFWGSISGSRISSYRDSASSFIQNFIGRIADALPDDARILNESFKESMTVLFADTLAALDSTIAVLSSWKLRKLLITTVGSINHRILASAWKICGGETAGFSHGNIYPYAYVPGDIINGAFQILDEFIVASEGEKRLLEYSRKDFNFGFVNKMKFTAIKGGLYGPIFDNLQKSPRVKGIKKIMYLGLNMDYINYAQLPDLNTLSYLRLEISILEDLRKAGFEVTYKAHPDTMAEIGQIYSEFCDNVVTERFERVCDSCDCLFFGTPYSTTFGYALMTQKPIVLMDSENNSWHSEILPLLEKRCSLVKMKLEQGGLISYSSEEMIAAVHSSMNKNDYQIIRDFAL